MTLKKTFINSGKVKHIYKKRCKFIKKKFWRFFCNIIGHKKPLEVRIVTKNFKILGKGSKKGEKYGLLPNLPRAPPPHPGFGLFLEKIDPHFLLENASVIAETNFTFGPMFKTNLFPL